MRRCFKQKVKRQIWKGKDADAKADDKNESVEILGGDMPPQFRKFDSAANAVEDMDFGSVEAEEAELC